MGLGPALLISFAARATVLTLLLWIMVKLQKLDYFFLGLLGSAVLASALDMIPYCGHYLAVPILYVCVWKATRASLMPDAIFTVAVAYALMFAVRVFVLTGLLPPIHPLAPEANLFAPQPLRVVYIPPVVTGPPTNQTSPATNLGPSAIIQKSADDWLREVTLKGITENGSKSMLLIRASTNLYKLNMNELTTVQTTNGTCQMRLVFVSENWATIEVNGETTYLRLH